jgi:hypothetical protein
MSQHYAPTTALYGQARTRRYIPWPIAIATMLIVGVIGGATGATLFGSRSTSTPAQAAETHSAPGDVRLTRCAVDPKTGWPSATLVVTNHGIARASYVVIVAFESTDQTIQYSTATATVQGLSSGQRATTVAEGLATAPRTFACAVASVNRE